MESESTVRERYLLVTFLLRRKYPVESGQTDFQISVVFVHSAHRTLPEIINNNKCIYLRALPFNSYRLNAEHE